MNKGVWFRKPSYLATSVRFLAGWIGKLANHVDWRGSRPKGVSTGDLLSVLELAEPGMVILTHTEYNLLNLILPGYYDHATLVSGHNELIEATGEGVNKHSIVKALSHCDKICLLKPLFATKELMEKAVVEATSQLGKPYDYNFEYQLEGDEKFYCSEVILWSYDQACKPLVAPFQPDYFLGQYTITPENIRKSQYWQVVFESKKTGDKI